MGAKKIQNEQEVIRWFEEGRTYDWMVAEYARRYRIEVVPSTFGNFRVRRGLPKRINRDDELIPWAVKAEHRWMYPLAMLRAEGRLRAGVALRAQEAERLEAFKRGLAEQGVVIHYDPDSEQGFSRVPRREGIDTGLIREPERPTARRRSVSDFDPALLPRSRPTKR